MYVIKGLCTASRKVFTHSTSRESVSVGIVRII